MNKPIIKSGRFSAGTDLQCGENVVIDVAEEIIVGDRCVLPDNAYFCGRRIEIGDDFFGYSWRHPAAATIGSFDKDSGTWLEIGRGRIDEEDAILIVGKQCTFHNNRIDLSRRVEIGDDVGLSPDVVIYTHSYWQSWLEGYPRRFEQVEVDFGVIVGFRSVILPGSYIAPNSVIGAQSVVTGELNETAIYGGNPAKKIGEIESLSDSEKEARFYEVVRVYKRTIEYRGLGITLRVDYPNIYIGCCVFDCDNLKVQGEEDWRTDDWREFAFKYGLRFFTKRLMRRMGRQK